MRFSDLAVDDERQITCFAESPHLSTDFWES